MHFADSIHRHRQAALHGAWVFVTLLSLLLVTASAQAHGSRSGGSPAGIAIPSLSHGEMAVISAYYGDIVDLAQSASDTNEPFRRVLNFSRIEYAACLWGQMPGSVTDEASPFNECSHAYLAAVKVVLLDMRTMPAEKKRAGDLVSRIDEEMALGGLALIGCQFSNEAFNTAEMIWPNWRDVPWHGPSALASLASLIVSVVACRGGMIAYRRHIGAATGPRPV
jgi:hypothetical protein